MKEQITTWLDEEGWEYDVEPAGTHFAWTIIVEVPVGTLLEPAKRGTVPVKIIKRIDSVSIINFLAAVDTSRPSDVRSEFLKIANPKNREHLAYALQERMRTIPEIRVTILLDDEFIPYYTAFEEEAHEEGLLAFDLFHRLLRLANCATQVPMHMRAVLFMNVPE